LFVTTLTVGSHNPPFSPPGGVAVHDPRDTHGHVSPPHVQPPLLGRTKATCRNSYAVWRAKALYQAGTEVIGRRSLNVAPRPMMTLTLMSTNPLSFWAVFRANTEASKRVLKTQLLLDELLDASKSSHTADLRGHI